MNELTETQKAYLAGLLDGDGCIIIAKHTTRSHVLRVHISQSDIFVLQMLQKMTGIGSVHKTGRQKENRRTVYQWMMNAKCAEIFLRAIFDYLIIKKKQAQIALEFRRFKRQHRLRKRNHQYVFSKREEYRLRLMAQKKEPFNCNKPLRRLDDKHHPMQLSYIL